MEPQLQILENSDGDEQLALAAGAPQSDGNDPPPEEPSDGASFCIKVSGAAADDLSESESEALTAQTANFLLINCDLPVEEVTIANDK